MILDYEYDFDAIHRDFHPTHLIKHHEKFGATRWVNYLDAPTILHHGEFFIVKK